MLLFVAAAWEPLVELLVVGVIFVVELQFCEIMTPFFRNVQVKSSCYYLKKLIDSGNGEDPMQHPTKNISVEIIILEDTLRVEHNGAGTLIQLKIYSSGYLEKIGRDHHRNLPYISCFWLKTRRIECIHVYTSITEMNKCVQFVIVVILLYEPLNKNFRVCPYKNSERAHRTIPCRNYKYEHSKYIILRF